MFPHIFPTFRHILPEFKGILPGFLPIQIFGVPLHPLRPSLLHQWLRSCKGFMHNKNTRIYSVKNLLRRNTESKPGTIIDQKSISMLFKAYIQNVTNLPLVSIDG